MRDTLVSFTVAKLAKEKGFNTPCIYYYNKEGELPDRYESSGSSTDTDVPIYLEEFEENFNSKGWVGDVFCSAPTQSLLAKWLRENYNKYIQCHPVYRDEKTQWEYVIFFLDDPLLSGTDGFKNRMSLLNHSYYWDTYEEALEKGLYQALKLIPNDSKN